MRQIGNQTVNVYEQLRSEAISALVQGRLQLDAHLLNKADDRRRGLTLVARPSKMIRGKVALCVERLMEICPGQYYYKPEEFHVTVLSVISGTEAWRPEMLHFPLFRKILGEVCKRQRSFRVKFRGLTASPGGVMVQGCPLDDGLTSLRNDLRGAFSHAGLQGLLDRRYAICTAHMTIGRFCRPVTDVAALLAFMEEMRDTEFGEMDITTLQLIWGDWYASADIVRTLGEYELPF